MLSSIWRRDIEVVIRPRTALLVEDEIMADLSLSARPREPQQRFELLEPLILHQMVYEVILSQRPVLALTKYQNACLPLYMTKNTVKPESKAPSPKAERRKKVKKVKSLADPEYCPLPRQDGVKNRCKPRQDGVENRCKPRQDGVENRCKPRQDGVENRCKPRKRGYCRE